VRTLHVDHRLSSAGYAQSNGLAEAAVKSVKHLLEKCEGKMSEVFYEGLLELRNTPRVGGKSPAEIVFGQPMRSRVPAHWRSFSKEWLVPMEEHDERMARASAKAAERYDASSKTLPPLQIGDHVRIQNMVSRRWDRTGVIVHVGRSRDYEIKLPSGRTWWRNRRFLRKITLQKCQENSEAKLRKSSMRRRRVRMEDVFRSQRYAAASAYASSQTVIKLCYVTCIEPSSY
jgi:hypothetical protein